MGCNCGGPAGYTKVWQHVLDGKMVAEHAEQSIVRQSQAAHNGAGRIQQVTKRVKTNA